MVQAHSARAEQAGRRTASFGAALLVATLAASFLTVCGPSPALAQLEDNLSSYTDQTAEGYLRPLSEAFGQSLNTGFFSSATIPREGFRVRLEVQAMSVFFKNGDDTFIASTGGNFSPEQEVKASTVVGPGDSKVVSGDGGTAFVFPGGFDLGSLSLAVPQLTVGSIAGTEATLRWIGVDTGDAELGDIDLFGLGVRHSLSQYFETLPVDLAASAFYQSLHVGANNLLDATAFSFGVQASREYGLLEPFASLTLDSFSMTSEYTVNEGQDNETRLKVDLGNELTPHVLAGVGLHLSLVHLHVAGNVADRVGVSGGMAIGF